MKVLVIGYPKTGTKTMHAALHILGYKVYDFEENCYYLGKQWMNIMSEKGGTKMDFYNMYKDVDVTMDCPACLFWEEILEAFPDAKLIFSERSSEEEWWKSLRCMFDNMSRNYTLKILELISPSGRSIHQYASRVCSFTYGRPPTKFWCSDYGGGVSPNIAKMLYRNHNARVREKAPKDQLLTFNLSDGWEPLCEFLEKPVPDCEFPHKNKKGTLIDEWMAESPAFLKMKREAEIILSVIFCVVGTAFIYFFALWP